MEQFTIQIAGMCIGAACMFGSTKEYFRAYLTDAPPEAEITVSDADLPMEQGVLNEEADAQGLRRRVFPSPFLERSYLMRRTAQLLLRRDTLMLHGSTVAVDGHGYLFTADCGVGKSTHTRLWREVFGPNATMVNDDRAFLKKEGEQILACGSPWTGKHGIGSDIAVPLAGICILNRGTENRIEPICVEEAFPFLEKQVFLPFPEDAAQVERVVMQLIPQISLWTMRCTKSPEAAVMAYNAMSGANSN